MRKLLLALLIALAFGTIAHAQNTKPRTSSGSKALLFSINGFGDFGIRGSYAGSLPTSILGLDTVFDIRLAAPIYGIGLRSYLSGNLALRASVGFTSSTASTPRAGDTTGKTDDVSDVFIGIAPALEIHLVNAGPVTAYTGAMLNYSTSWRTKGDAADTLVGETKTTYSSIGGAVLFGVEYFPWSAVSLGAEYQLGVASTTSSSKNKGKSKDGKSYLDIGISTVAVSLGVYF